MDVYYYTISLDITYDTTYYPYYNWHFTNKNIENIT